MFIESSKGRKGSSDADAHNHQRGWWGEFAKGGVHPKRKGIGRPIKREGQFGGKRQGQKSPRKITKMNGESTTRAERSEREGLKGRPAFSGIGKKKSGPAAAQGGTGHLSWLRGGEKRKGPRIVWSRTNKGTHRQMQKKEQVGVFVGQTALIPLET